MENIFKKIYKYLFQKDLPPPIPVRRKRGRPRGSTRLLPSRISYWKIIVKKFKHKINPLKKDKQKILDYNKECLINRYEIVNLKKELEQQKNALVQQKNELEKVINHVRIKIEEIFIQDLNKQVDNLFFTIKNKKVERRNLILFIQFMYGHHYTIINKKQKCVTQLKITPIDNYDLQKNIKNAHDPRFFMTNHPILRKISLEDRKKLVFKFMDFILIGNHI